MTRQRSLRPTVLHLPLLLLVVAGPLAAQSWKAGFSAPGTVQSAGQYTDNGTSIALETFSPLLLEPSPTAAFTVVPLSQARALSGLVSTPPPVNQMVISDPKPSLKPATSPDAARFYERGDGAISALGWVNAGFTDLRVSGEVNVQGGPNGQGSQSRQGMFARWDLGNNFYWFALDFSTGTFEIVRAKYFGVFAPLAGSTGKVTGFLNTRSYLLELELVGGTLHGRVYEPWKNGVKGQLVGDTGAVADPSPQLSGVAGFLAEPALQSSFTPLEASFANLAAVSLTKAGAAPVSTASLQISDVPEGARSRHDRARVLLVQGDPEGAVVQLREALKIAPDFVEALSDLAGIRATSANPKLRDSREAVVLAERAVGRMVELFNRRLLSPPSSQEAPGFTKNFLIRTGVTLGAAYSAAGRYSAAPDRRAAPGARKSISLGEAVTDQQAATALEDCAETGTVESVASWVVALARQEYEKTMSAETQALLLAGEELMKSAQERRAAEGLKLPM
jgi:hypothetical protein